MRRSSIGRLPDLGSNPQNELLADAVTEPRIDEGHLKARVLSELRRDGLIDSRTPIASEFRLRNAPTRADLALFGQNFIGVEIKSKFDTLRRLEAQLEAYGKWFEHSILVVAERHVRSSSLEGLGNVELWTVDGIGRITRVREGVIARRQTGFASLMTLEEQRRFLTRSEDSERCAFAASFRAKYGETSTRFWEAIKGRRIHDSDIAMLSRYCERRERQVQLQRDRDLRNSRWCERATELLSVASG